ncbi:MAG TPA: hypothetical protein VLE53_00920 [Gemmatimonadaceae bacterium]|nr:hypothetical protein [Gemmatimonadaceae bacterium]
MRHLAGAVVLLLLGCTAAGAPETASTPAAPAARDSSRLLVPAGYGSLRQEDIAIRLKVQGIQVQAIPLDETVIRLLSPDSYRAMRELVSSQGRTLETISRRTALRSFSLWDVRFHGDEPGETPFSPMEFIVTSVGRDFRPIDIIPLTAGFGRQRLQQRATQRALYVFDPQVDVNQPLTVQYETSRSADWTLILPRLERERALVRSRAGIQKPS